MKTNTLKVGIAVAALVVGVGAFVTMPEGRALSQSEKIVFQGLERYHCAKCSRNGARCEPRAKRPKADGKILACGTCKGERGYRVSTDGQNLEDAETTISACQEDIWIVERSSWLNPFSEWRWKFWKTVPNAEKCGIKTLCGQVPPYPDDCPLPKPKQNGG